MILVLLKSGSIDTIKGKNTGRRDFWRNMEG